MILDRENHVAAALAIAGTGNLLATDVIDLGVTRDIAAGSELFFYHNISIAAAAGGTSVEFQTVTSDDVTFATGVIVVASAILLTAELPINFLFFQRLQRRAVGLKYGRYLTTRLVRAGTFTGTAAWSSGITYDVTDFRQFYTAPFFT